MATAPTTNRPSGDMGYVARSDWLPVARSDWLPVARSDWLPSDWLPVAAATKPNRLQNYVMGEIMRKENRIAHKDGSLSVNFKKPDGVTESDLIKTMPPQMLAEMMEKGNLKFEKDGWVSMKFDRVTAFHSIGSSFKVGAAIDTSEISELPLPHNHEEIVYKKTILFLNAQINKESTGDEVKVVLVKVHLPAGMFQEMDMTTAIEDGKLRIQLKPYYLEGNWIDNIAKVVELPEDVNVWKITSTVMEDGILTVTVTGDKQVPEKKLKGISKFLGSAKKALVSALPACFLMGGKMLVDDMTNVEDQ